MVAPVEPLVARPAVVGTATVLRYLPRQARRLVGAWCFLDVFSGEGSVGVGPHPHIGIQTATWLTAGATVHRDSIGSETTVGPGELSLMTAGSGVAHAEEPSPGRPEGVGAQLWVALPEAVRSSAPSYECFARPEELDLGGGRLLVFMGSLAGGNAPPRPATPLVGAQLDLEAGATVHLPVATGFEHAVIALSGGAQVAVGGGAPTAVAPGQGAFLAPGTEELRIGSDSGTRLLLVGGQPFAEQIVMWWNLVARSEEEIIAAREDWEHGRRFGEVQGSSPERIPAPPLPPGRLRPRNAARTGEA